MTISDLAEQQIEPIVDEWVEFARTRLPSSHDFSRDELADHAKVLLLAIAADVRNAESAGAKHGKSQGNKPDDDPEITRIARQHAAQRFDQGFSLDHLLSEFRALRASVIRRWTTQIGQAGRKELDELTRFGEAMDQALSVSASLYSRKVDDSRNLLLGILGHDLRTPLGVIHMSAGYLLRTDALDGAQTKAAARILTSAERMKAMVKDILDFTQTAFGMPLPIAPAPADLGQLTRSIVGEIAALVPASRMELSCEGDLSGRWDGGRISQMLSNLIGNAIQHGKAEVPVSVRVSGCAQEVRVEIWNDAPRIPLEAQKTLFLPLRQTPAAEGQKRAGSSGLGLGLYIAREIAVAHGGTIRLASDESGTTFAVSLPRKPPARTSAPAAGSGN